MKLQGDILIVLGMVMRPGVRPSYRDIGKVIGKGPRQVQIHLEELRKLGLVTWEHGEHRTLMPTCRFIPESQL